MLCETNLVFSKWSFFPFFFSVSSWRNQDKMPSWIFGKINLELSSHSFHKIAFGSFRHLYSHKTQTSLWSCWLIWLSASIGSKTNRSYMRISSIDLGLLVSNTLKNIFVLRTSSLLCFKDIVNRLNVYVKS